MSAAAVPEPAGAKRCAVICVLQADDDFLLLLRAREPHRGLFTPVGGKLEPHESPRAAAHREIREETGYDVSGVRLLGTLVESSPVAYNWWSAVYHAIVPHRPPPPCAEGELRWIPRAALATTPMPRTDLHIYEYLLRGVPFAFSAEYDASLMLRSMVEELAGTALA